MHLCTLLYLAFTCHAVTRSTPSSLVVPWFARVAGKKKCLGTTLIKIVYLVQGANLWSCEPTQMLAVRAGPPGMTMVRPDGRHALAQIKLTAVCTFCAVPSNVFVVQSDARSTGGPSISVHGIINSRGAALRVQCGLDARGGGGMCTALPINVALARVLCVAQHPSVPLITKLTP